MTTDIYAPSWLITIFSRRLPVPIVLYIWNRLLKTQKAYSILFIGISLLLVNKAMLMSLPLESLPGALVKLKIQNETEVDMLFEVRRLG